MSSGATSNPATGVPVEPDRAAVAKGLLEAAQGHFATLQPKSPTPVNLRAVVGNMSMLPTEMLAEVLDKLAASQPYKYGHIEDVQMVDVNATDLLSHLPAVNAGTGSMLRPSVSWFALAREAIIKNAWFHQEITKTQFYDPGLKSMKQLVFKIALTIKMEYHHPEVEDDDAEMGEDAVVLLAAMQFLPVIQTHFPNLDALEVIVKAKAEDEEVAVSIGTMDSTNSLYKVMGEIGADVEKTLKVFNEVNGTWTQVGPF